VRGAPFIFLLHILYAESKIVPVKINNFVWNLFKVNVLYITKGKMADFKTNPPDEDLLKRAKEGDEAAFEVFYNRYKMRILNYAYRMIYNFESAKEIAQDVFVKAYINLPRYKARGRPLSWIYTIAGNLCKNYLRDKRHEERLLLNKELPHTEGLTMQDIIPSNESSPSELNISKEMEELMQMHIMRLPLRYRQVVVSCDIDGCSYEEAAQLLRCKIGTIKSRLSRARLLLAKSLSKYFQKKRD